MNIITEITAELARATAKFPTWPTDPLHALGVVHEEVGELSKEVLQLVYEPHKTSPAKVREEAIQAAAMALRFAMSLDNYVAVPGPQHEQVGPIVLTNQKEWGKTPNDLRIEAEKERDQARYKAEQNRLKATLADQMRDAAILWRQRACDLGWVDPEPPPLPIEE